MLLVNTSDSDGPGRPASGNSSTWAALPRPRALPRPLAGCMVRLQPYYASEVTMLWNTLQYMHITTPTQRLTPVTSTTYGQPNNHSVYHLQKQLTTIYHIPSWPTNIAREKPANIYDRLRLAISADFYSPRKKRGSMFLPALVCACLYVTTITKKIMDGFVQNFMGRFLGGKGRPTSCFVAIVKGMWK